MREEGHVEIHLRWLFVLLALATFAEPALGQSRSTSADLSGIVRDESGAVLPGATVTVTNVDTNLQRVALTDGEGRFDVFALPPATYRVRAELAGFSPHVFEGVELRLGSLMTLEMKLNVAGLETRITVAAESPLLNLQQAV